MEVVVVNDIIDNSMLVYLFKFDLILGWLFCDVGFEGDDIIVVGCVKIKVFVVWEGLVVLLWGDFGVDVVVEFIGLFINVVKVKGYLDVGVKKVIIFVFVIDEDIIIVLGVNDDKYDGS